MRDDLIRYLKKKIMRTLLFPLKILPVKKNRVLMYNSLSKYSCNPKYITEYLLKSYPNELEIIFTVTNPKIKEKIEKKELFV